MPYKVNVVKTTVKDSDGLNITFDLLAGNLQKETIEVTPTEEPEPTDDGGEG